MASIEITTAPDITTALAAVVYGQTVVKHLRHEVGLDAAVDTQHDVLLERKFRSAYDWIEENTGRSLLTQTLTVLFDAREARSPVDLPRWPARSITSVTTYDTDDTATVVSSSNYRLEGSTGASAYVLDPRLVATSSAWSTGREIAAMKVVFVAGYGAISDVPMMLFEALVSLTDGFFANQSKKRRPAVPELVKDAMYTYNVRW